MKTNIRHKILSVLIASTMVMSSVVTFAPKVDAKEVPKSREITNVPYANKKTLQPYGNCMQIDELKYWSPDKDPDARYNKGSIPLQKRVTGPLVNENASTEARVMSLNKLTSESQGTESAKAYAFNNFQYLDTFNFWGGSEGQGVMQIPTPERIDAAHRNGVKVTGTIFFPWGDSQFVTTAMTQFTEQDENGKFIIAEKLFEIADYYGFDGFFINEESSVSPQLATKLREMLKYIQENKPEGFIMQWYDSMNSSGTVSYQNCFNQNNINMLQDGDVRYNDEGFMNFNWSTSRINTTVETMKNAGRSPFDAFASWENIPYEDYANHPGRADFLLDENKKVKTSIGMLDPTTTLSASENPEDFINNTDSILWVGPNKDPRDTTSRDNKQKFPGMSSLIADKTPIVGTDFITHFTTGNGYKFYENGVVTGKEKGWSNLSLTETLPTWRWIVDSNGSKLQPSIDFSDAYWAGTSLNVKGKLEKENPNHIKLYSTKLDIKSKSKLSITYKTPLNATNMQVGLCFGDDYSDKNFAFIDVPNGTPGEWNTQEFDLSKYADKTAIAISLKFASNEDIENYSINIGRLAITTKTPMPTFIENESFDEILFHDHMNAEARIYWEKSYRADFYKIHRVRKDGTREFIGATPNTAYYIPLFERDGDEIEFNFEITPVTYAGKEGPFSTLTFKWTEPLNTSEPIEKVKPINLAFGKPTTSNVTAETGQETKNLVDGIIPNSKWCVSSTKASTYNPHEAIVDLGKEEEISRWVVYHADAPGANEGPAMNTRDFKLRYSNDGVNFTDADVVVGNEAAITDRNLETPIKARYVQLQITKSDISPWSATRVYEFEVYKDKLVKKRIDTIVPDLVVAKNNVGATDIVVAKNVPVGIIVNLYKDLTTSEVLISAKADSTGVVKFENLDLGEASGRIYYSLANDSNAESLRRSVAFDAETGEKTAKPAQEDIKVLRSVKGMQAPQDKLIGVLKIDNVAEGTVLKVYNNETDLFPILKSAPVAKGNSYLIQERVPLVAEGGKIFFELKENGKNASERFEISYGLKDTLYAEISGLADTYMKYLNVKNNNPYTYDANANYYTDETWNSFNQARSEFDAFNTNIKAQEQIKAKNKLIIAARELKSKDAKLILVDLYDANKDKIESTYTKATWAEFKKALDEAKALLVKEELTEIEVKTAIENLNKAVKGLVKASTGGSTGGGSGSVTPTEPTNPTNPTSPTETVAVYDDATNVMAVVPGGIKNVSKPRLEVKKLANNSQEVAKLIKAAKGYKLVSQYEIDLYDGETKVTQVEGGKIRVSIPYADIKANTTYVVLRLNDNGTVTELKATAKDGRIEFETDHFSTYAIAVKNTVAEKPVAPTTPSTKPTKNPQTGDSNPMLPLAVLVTLLGVTTVSGLVVRKKSKQN